MLRRIIVVFALVMALLPLTAAKASAEPVCTANFYGCINDAYWLGPLAELECSLEWIGCVGKKTLFY